ncbi:hypothetical protein JQN58_06790 [Aneurinibacillus sp. BA2021]|nr:hypothetical protein [Aneurinibacillus sp. BA2021]
MDSFNAEARSYGDPAEVAELVAHVAAIKRPALRYPIGKHTRMMLRLQQCLPWNLWRRLVERTLTR